MVQRDLITTINIPLYIREVQLSKSVRPKFYEWDGKTIKCKSKKLLQKYIRKYCKESIIRNNGNVLPEFLRENYKIIGFKGKYIYCELDSMYEPTNVQLLTKSILKKKTKYILCEEVEDGEKTYSYIYKPVIANQTKAGKPNIQVINGQNIYNHTASPFTTGKIFDNIKEMYYQKFITIPPIKLELLRKKFEGNYPLQIEVELGDTVKNFYDNTKEGNGRIWDVGNRTDPYMKTFLDFITKGLKDVKPLIEEDDRLHVTTGNNSHFTPVATHEDRFLKFYFYQDTREIWNLYK
jgi:hypothetical protein